MASPLGSNSQRLRGERDKSAPKQSGRKHWPSPVMISAKVTDSKASRQRLHEIRSACVNSAQEKRASSIMKQSLFRCNLELTSGPVSTTPRSVTASCGFSELTRTFIFCIYQGGFYNYYRMANLEDDLHAVLFITCSTLGEQAGSFTRLKTSVFSRHKHITEMAKRMASRTHAEGQMLLGTVLIKQLHLLIWWIRDNAIYRNGDLSSMQQDSPLRLRVRNDNNLRWKVLGRFDPDDFDAYEDARFSQTPEG
jgi:hypothetical protein